MISTYRKLSLRNKIASLIIMMIILFATTGLYINFQHENAFVKEKHQEEKILTAKIVGSYSASDLAFGNQISAVQSLSYLKSDESIINAHLYTENGKHFVSLYPDSTVPNIEVKKGEQKIYNGNHLIIVEPVKIDQELLGYLVLESSTKAYAETYDRNVLFFIVMFAGLVFTAVIVAAPVASLVTSPVKRLAEAAKNVSEKNNYIETVTKENQDEIGDLIDAFNEMLIKLNLREKERDDANSALIQNKEYLDLILNNMVIGVITVDHQWRIKSYNAQAENIFHYHESEITGKSLFDLITTDHRERLQNEIDYYFENGSLEILGKGIEVKGVCKDGKEFPLHISVSDMREPRTGEVLFILSCEDITTKKLQEEQVRRSQRMDALGNLTGGVAHDYNNMLGVILGYTELIAYSKEVPESVNKYISEISHAANRAKALTTRLLDFTKRSATEAEVVNINAVLKNSSNMIERTLTLKVQVNYELEEALWNTWLDHGDLEDAILNLSINAMHAMENGGQLEFKTRNVSLNEIEAASLSLNHGDYVLMQVSDTGTGMDEATRIRIFEPFFSTKDDKGTGLGLSQVYGFVKRSNGEVKVFSIAGEGTRFDFYFPRYHSQTSNNYKKRLEEIENYDGNEKVLIVDDEEGLREYVKELLTLHGYKVTCAGGAEEALKILENKSFDLLFSDVIMTGMDGYELAAIVREKYPAIKIQMASGYSENWPIKEELKDLYYKQLQKPFEKELLLKQIRMLLDNKLT